MKRPTAQQLEALAWMAEECAEVIQAVNKIIRHGIDSRNPLDPDSNNNAENLATEMGHVMLTMTACIKYGIVNEQEIEDSREIKKASANRWLHNITTEGL